MGITHAKVLTDPDNPLMDVSTNSWNADHVGHDLALHSSLGISSFSSGMLMMWAGLIASVPSGWILCDGSSLLRSAYPDLFAAIGTAFGSADGTHFNIPDYRSIFPKGAANGQNPGGTGGSTTLTHAGCAVDAHAAHTHPYGTIAVANHAAHTHAYGTLAVANHTMVSTKQGSSSGNVVTTNTHTVSGSTDNPSATLTHSVSGSTDNPSASLTHNVTQPSNHTGVEPPYCAIAFIIKT
jgi:microcystin-dependent protein